MVEAFQRPLNRRIVQVAVSREEEKHVGVFEHGPAGKVQKLLKLFFGSAAGPLRDVIGNTQRSSSKLFRKAVEFSAFKFTGDFSQNSADLDRIERPVVVVDLPLRGRERAADPPIAPISMSMRVIARAAWKPSSCCIAW